MKLKLNKNTPREYLIYLANFCRKEIKESMSTKIRCRDEGKYLNKITNDFQDILEKINKLGVKTDIYGNLN